MTLFEKIEEISTDPVQLTNFLIQLDSWLEYLHNNNFYIYDFNPKKIVLENGKLTFNSFRLVLGNLSACQNAKEINIFQNSKIGLFAYNHMPVDGNMNQEHFNFLQDNLEKFNQLGIIPEEIYEYYEEVFRRLKVCYMNDYLVKKQQANSNQNTNVRRKTLSTAIGRAFVNEETAYVNILFIPSILTLIYLIGLFVYTFILR